MNKTCLASARTAAGILALFSLSTIAGADQIRVAAWNVSVYGGGRTADIQQAVFDTFQGRSMNPDVIIAQEIWTSGVTPFLSALNTNTYNTGAHDWAAAYNPAHMGNSSTATNDVVFYYRTSKLTALNATPTLVDTGSSSSGTAPRDTFRADFSINGNANTSQVLALYGNHMKAGSSTGDDPRRNITATAVRNDAQGLNSNYSYLFGGDMNVQSSSEQSYQTFIASTANNNGRFFDPIKTPGTWNAANAFRFVHTQAPSNLASGSGGMDDRYDQLLISQNLTNSANSLHYVGDTTQAYSTTTWNDPNHSYRAWGNDGTSFNNNLTVTGNTMVGPGIAQALINTTGTDGGHLPVFLDLSFQAQAVPEPTTLAVLGLGALAMVRRRRQAK